MFSVLKVLLGSDTTIDNVKDRLDCLIARLDEIVYAEDRDLYPSRYLELTLRLRLHLSVLKLEILPFFADRLFFEEIELVEANHIQRLFDSWNHFFSAKEIPPPAIREAGKNSVFVEINLDAIEADVLTEIKKIMEAARKECYLQSIFRKDSFGRYVKFPFKSALSALITYEKMKKSGEKTPTRSAIKSMNTPEINPQRDNIIRRTTRLLNENFDTYLFWNELECEITPLKNSLLTLSKEEIKSLKE